MKETVTFPWKSPRGQDLGLALHWWKNKYNATLPPRGYIWIVHGIGEHGARYHEVASFLTQLGFDVLAPDQVGHGLNREHGDDRARLFDLKAMRSVMSAALRFWMTQSEVAKAGAHKKPWFILSHSLGSLLTLSWILKARQEGFDLDFATAAFVSAPPLELQMPVPEWKKMLAEKVHGLAPYLEIKNDISIDFLSHEDANRADYAQDKLVHPYASPDLFLSILEDSKYVLQNSQDIEIPLAVAVGSEDPIVNVQVVKNYYDSLSTHKSFVLMEGMKHEILNDLNKRELYKIVAEWFI